MALSDLVLSEIFGAETGGLQELDSSIGSPTVVASTPSPKTGGFSYKLAEGDSITFDNNVRNKNSFFSGLQVSGAPSATETIAEFLDSSGVVIASIDINTSRELLFNDQTGTLITGGTSSAITSSAWHRISWNIEVNATGWSYSEVDGTTVVDSASEDHFNSAANGSRIRFTNPTSSGMTFIAIDDAIIFDATGAGVVRSDVLQDAEVLPFSTTHAATTTDIGSEPTNNWDQAAEFPGDDADFLVFDSVGSAKFCDQTSGDGPQGSADIDGDQHIIAAKFWHRMGATGGQSRTHHSVHGHDGNTTTTVGASVTLKETIRSLGVPADFFLIETNPLFIPGVNQHAAIGVGKDATAGQDTELYEAICMVLHIPRPTPTTPTNLSDLNFGTQNSYHGPYQTV